MKKNVIFVIAMFIFFVGKAQQLSINISSGEKIIRGELRDTLIVQEDIVNKEIRLIITILNTDKKTVVRTFDLDQSTAKLDMDYSYKGRLSKTYDFNSEENMTKSIAVEILGDKEKENAEFVELNFKWDNFLKEKDQVHKILVIKILDKEVKNKDIKNSEKPDTDTRHADNTNGNKIEYIQFTDFSGFDNDKPNGRLQTELRIKWGIAKKWHGKENGWQAQLFRSVIFPDILLNRIDKSQREESYDYKTYLKGPAGPDSSAPKFTTMDIWKYSNLQIGVRVILAAFKKDNFRFHLQAGTRLVRNKPFVDTTVSQNGKTDSAIFRSTYSVAYNIEVFGKTLLDDKENINLDFNTGIMWLYLHDSYYKQYDAAVIDPYNKASILLPVSFPSRKVKPVYMLSFRLTKNFGTDDDHYIYLRGSWMYQTGKYFPVYKRTTNDGNIIYQVSQQPSRFYNNFLQIQAGISLDVKDLFKKNKETKKEKTATISDAAG